MKKNIRFETIAIHGGGPMDPATGAVVTPIYQTSTFKQSKIGEHKGFETLEHIILHVRRLNELLQRLKWAVTDLRFRRAWRRLILCSGF